MISDRFPQPKDPAAIAFYLIGVGEQIQSVIDMVTEDIGAAPGTGFRTPGDDLTGGNLVIDNWNITTADMTWPGAPKVPAGQGITFRLSGGQPGRAYAVRAHYATSAATDLYRSVILYVAGR